MRCQQIIHFAMHALLYQARKVAGGLMGKLNAAKAATAAKNAAAAKDVSFKDPAGIAGENGKDEVVISLTKTKSTIVRLASAPLPLWSCICGG